MSISLLAHKFAVNRFSLLLDLRAVRRGRTRAIQRIRVMYANGVDAESPARSVYIQATNGSASLPNETQTLRRIALFRKRVKSPRDFRLWGEIGRRYRKPQSVHIHSFSPWFCPFVNDVDEFICASFGRMSQFILFNGKMAKILLALYGRSARARCIHCSFAAH